MNYERIYAAFIDDRKARQPESPTYFEKHHIVPRAVGGGDESSNLVRLTPEDHYFAHLLLAKIHGGSLWACVLLLSGRRRYNTPWAEVVGKSRYGYGLARRKHGELERGKEGLKGADNGNYNPTRFHWINLDTGAKERKTLHEMWAAYGGTRGTWTSCAVGGRATSCQGWAIDDGSIRLRSSKGKTFDFVNTDGRTFTGSQKAFCDSIQLSYGAGTRLVRHHGVTLCGWRLSTTAHREPGNAKSTGIPARRNAGKVYKLVGHDGAIVQGRRIELAQIFGIQTDSMSATIGALSRGEIKSYRGYTIASEAA